MKKMIYLFACAFAITSAYSFAGEKGCGCGGGNNNDDERRTQSEYVYYAQCSGGKCPSQMIEKLRQEKANEQVNPGCPNGQCQAGSYQV